MQSTLVLFLTIIATSAQARTRIKTPTIGSLKRVYQQQR